MFTTLSQFYTSKDWRAFREGLINKRTSKKDGILYSEHSGKPITLAYDIVLHHITPLTIANVNDYSISLNPENIMIVSQREHNEIHARFGYCAERKVYYIYGSPCAGKTTYVNQIKGNSDLVVDMDNIWACINGGNRYEKPDALKQYAFMIRDTLYQMIKTRAGNWERCYIITGGAVKGIREREIESFGAEPIFINTSQKECLQRLSKDKNRTETQKKEWIKYINQWFEDYIE